MAQFEVLAWHLSGRTEKNQKIVISLKPLPDFLSLSHANTRIVPQIMALYARTISQIKTLSSPIYFSLPIPSFHTI
jgi:hypothetical protein